jgi:hypothetical protein
MNMPTAFVELLPTSSTDKPQIWIIVSRDQVNHIINEFCVKQVTNNRAKFTSIIPAPFSVGKYMVVLVR